jgi:hypothetical protein
VADLATRLSAVSAEGELAGTEVLHAEVEEGVALFPVSSLLYLRVYPQVHVPVNGRVVVPYGYALRCREELPEIAGRRGDGITRERLMVVGWDIIVGHVVEVIAEVILRGRGIRID